MQRTQHKSIIRRGLFYQTTVIYQFQSTNLILSNVQACSPNIESQHLLGAEKSSAEGCTTRT